MVQIFRVSFSSKSHNQSTQKENMGFLAAYLFQENPAQEEKDVLRLKKVLFVLFSGKKRNELRMRKCLSLLSKTFSRLRIMIFSVFVEP